MDEWSEQEGRVSYEEALLDARDDCIENALFEGGDHWDDVITRIDEVRWVLSTIRLYYDSGNAKDSLQKKLQVLVASLERR